MPNHVHLLIKEKENTIGQICGSVASKFAIWYNTKYERVGYLFQDRFKSEAVETNEYFLTVIRYIHQNPVKAGLCKKVSDYEFSSYNEYLTTPFLINKEFVFECTNEQSFLALHNEITDDNCLEINENTKIRVTEEKAQMIFQKITNCKNEGVFNGKTNKYNVFTLETTDEFGMPYQCEVKPARNSDKSLLVMLLNQIGKGGLIV